MSRAAGTATMTADLEEIRSAVRVLLQPGAVHESRILNTPKGTVSGYYDDLDRLVQDAARWSGRASGVYVTLNPVNPVLLARSANRLTEFAKHTTADADIVKRRWLPIDFDPVRPAGISSTDEEHAVALQRAQMVAAWLAERGWPSPIVGDSGNGGHLLYPIDLLNADPARRLIEQALKALGFWFTDDAVAVDVGTFNAARIWKVYGTLAAKGDSLSERPHRLSRILEIPESFEPVPVALLEALAALAPAPQASSHHGNGHSSLDVEGWLNAHGLEVSKVKPWQGGTLYELAVCPWNAEHRRSARVIQFASGALSVACFHNSCAAYRWRDLREMLEPPSGAVPGADFEPNGTPGSEEQEQARKSERNKSIQSLTLTPLGDLLVEPEEQVDWIVEKRLPSGGLSLLSGKPKAGKSTLARCLCLAVARGQEVLEFKTTQATVFYLGLEEKRGEVRKHFRSMGATADDAVKVFIAPSPTDGLQQLRAAVEQQKPGLIVIDPIVKFTRVKDLNDYAQVTAALEPLLTLARETDVHVLAVHHLGKGERAGGDAILGSTALFAAVDTALLLKRTERYRTLSSIQRYGEDLEEITLTLDPVTKTISAGPSRKEADQAKTEQAILDFLKKHDEPVEREVIEEAVEGRTGTKREALKTLVEQQKITRSGKGTKGDPFKFLFLVPTYIREQENKNSKNNLTSDEYGEDSCSGGNMGSDDAPKSWEHATEAPKAGVWEAL